VELVPSNIGVFRRHALQPAANQPNEAADDSLLIAAPVHHPPQDYFCSDVGTVSPRTSSWHLIKLEELK
jgi:hypothetical protein